ncbi:hypothetical protein D9M72_567340 [compost metagenome]
MDTPTSAESTPSGTIRIIASGSTQLSYWAASARNTKTTDSAKMNTAVLPVWRSWKASSVHSKVVPCGRIWAASASILSRAVPVETPGAGLPCTGTDTYML